MKYVAISLLTASVLVGCTASAYKDVGSASFGIQKGMSQNQVWATMEGFPAERTFKGRGTAIQFCSGNAKYVVVWLVDDAVEGLTQYKKNTGITSCTTKWREVDWGQAPADVKIKLDID